MCLIIIGLCFFIQWANSPSKQTTIINSDTDTSSTIIKPDTVVTTNIFTTHIPSGFRFQIASDPHDSSRIQVTAFSTQKTDMQIGIVAAPLPYDGLNGVADYLYRLKTPDSYESIDSVAFPAESPTFRKKNNGSELTSFIMRNNQYCSVVVSGSNVSTATLDSVMYTLAKNWRWL